jgi:tetratricopeptide (TPR) repeat protein
MTEAVALFTFAGLVGLAAFYVFALRIGSALAERAVRHERPHQALWIGSVLRRFPGASHKFIGNFIYARTASDIGLTNEAIRAAREVVAVLERNQKKCFWSVLNLVIDLFVNAGLYTEAEALPRRWSKQARRAGRRNDLQGFLLTQVNRAEALHNLGRDDEALRLLDKTLKREHLSSLMLSGALTLRAWILAHTGRPLEAAENMQSVDPPALGPRYEAELYFTRAAIARELGELEQAKLHAESGLKTARRASSQRNALFLLGSIFLRGQDWRAAIEYFERGLAHRYQAQGGPSLVELGDAYAKLEDHARAAKAYAAAFALDPESWAAARARERLAQLERRLAFHACGCDALNEHSLRDEKQDDHR